MKNLLALLCISFLLFASCKREGLIPASGGEYYTGIYDFYSRNEPKMQAYTVSGSSGGGFTTPQGTNVIIPANAFVTIGNTPVTGMVTIQFKDLYKKSDMLLSNILPVTMSGQLLKSGGEFFMQALSNGSAIYIAPGKKIDIKQPINLTGAIDTAMEAFVGQFANFTMANGWFGAPIDSMGGPMAFVSMDTLAQQANDYVYSLYQFSTPVSSGTWSNSDNSTYFSSYATDTLNIVPNDNPLDFGTQVYLIFTDVNSMVHVYYDGFNNYPYQTAPQGLQCTIVAIGFKNGQLHSAFVPITIGNNQSVNFTLSQTTTANFIGQLQTLN